MQNLEAEARRLPSVSAAESKRMAALESFQVLDTPPDARLDAFTRLAARALRAPIALVSLLDSSRQWFKSSYGLDVRETPREWAFCDHTIGALHGVMDVADATLDPRFLDNPLVLGPPFIRAYAGASLEDEAGNRLGALCVLDNTPRDFTAAELEALRDLASGVSAALLNHRATLLLQRAATTDPLTGLANRAVFMARLQQVLSSEAEPRRRRGRGGAQTRAAALVLDLERFKAVHDLFGHRGGEAVLVETARRLAGAVRTDDLLAHFGGDMFGIMLTDVADQDAAIAVAERLLASLADPFDVEHYPVVMRGSVGLALSASAPHSAARLVANADAALWRAKRGDGGRIACFTPDIARQQQTRRGLELDLRAAADRGELLLHFQPIVGMRGESVAGARVLGHEALIRWQRRGHELLMPDEFLPCAETTGLMPQLDRWVLREACRMAMDCGGRVAVNVSAASLVGGAFAAQVSETLTGIGLDAARLEIELTEHSPIGDVERAAAELRALKALGCRLVLDDFGTGYSSLNTLRVMPFDKVKLDRSLVMGLGQDERTEAMAGAVIEMGHALGLAVCGEGVETDLQWSVLRRLGCDEIQGYLVGRPAALMMPIAA